MKTGGPKRGAKRSANPTHVLLVGDPSARLVRDLKASGHQVEVADSADSAKRSSYGVVMTDEANASAARKRFPGQVAMYSGDAGADRDQVEKRVARSTVRTSEPRVVVARAAKPQPVAAGPKQRDEVARAPVASSPPEEEPPAAPPPQARSADVQRPSEASKPAAEPVASTTPTPRRAKSEAPASAEPAASAEAPAAAPRRPKRNEIYFTYGHFILSRTARKTLADTAKWLSANPDLKVTIEGHADPHGVSSANQTLSEHRADAVKGFLVDNGVGADRIETVGFGDTRLKYSADDRRNRRVAIVPAQ